MYGIVHQKPLGKEHDEVVDGPQHFGCQTHLVTPASLDPGELAFDTMRAISLAQSLEMGEQVVV